MKYYLSACGYIVRSQDWYPYSQVDDVAVLELFGYAKGHGLPI
jgi:hypothetical protein